MKLKDMKVGEAYAISTDRNYLDTSWRSPAKAVLLDDKVWHEGYHGWGRSESKTVVVNGVEYKGVPGYIGPGGKAGEKNGALMLLVEGYYAYKSPSQTPMVIMGMHIKGQYDEAIAALEVQNQMKKESYERSQASLEAKQERAEVLWELFEEKGIHLGHLSAYGVPGATFDIDDLEDLYHKLA